MKKTFTILLVAISFLQACNANRERDKIHTAAFISNSTSSTTNSTKPIVNVYIENSGSMDGYVAGVTEFEQAVYNYLTDIKISGISDSLNLFYINSKIIPQGSDISDFIEKLEPSTFQLKGGNRGVSDISYVLKSILSETNRNEIAILVTDGIFSPGKGRNAAEYLDNQQIGIKNTMAEYLKSFPNTAVVIYQLSSKFNGYYYNREDSRTYANSQRPFYVWLIGDAKQINQLCQQVPESKFKGTGILNVFSIVSGNRDINYAVKLGSGKFELNKKFPKTMIHNLQEDNRGRQNKVRFSVNANLSCFLLDDKYLNNTSNYQISNKDFNLTITKAATNPLGYTHQLNFTSESVHKGIVSVKLLTQIPKWVEDANDNDGLKPIEGKTYGIKYQIYGIYEAYTFKNDYYTEIKINIE